MYSVVISLYIEPYYKTERSARHYALFTKPFKFHYRSLYISACDRRTVIGWAKIPRDYSAILYYTQPTSNKFRADVL